MVRGAPIPDRLMRGTELTVGSEVRYERCGASGSGRSNDLASARKRPVELDADLEANGTIPIDRHVPPSLELLGADERPHHAARFGNDGGELGGARLAAHNYERDAANVCELDFVERHAVLDWLARWVQAARGVHRRSDR